MKFNKVCFALLMLLAIASQSCTDMNDLTDKYLDEGEIVYAAKVDSVGAVSYTHLFYYEGCHSNSPLWVSWC